MTTGSEVSGIRDGTATPSSSVSSLWGQNVLPPLIRSSAHPDRHYLPPSRTTSASNSAHESKSWWLGFRLWPHTSAYLLYHTPLTSTIAPYISDSAHKHKAWWLVP